jgi:hypothetical protein
VIGAIGIDLDTATASLSTSNPAGRSLALISNRLAGEPARIIV